MGGCPGTLELPALTRRLVLELPVLELPLLGSPARWNKKKPTAATAPRPTSSPSAFATTQRCQNLSRQKRTGAVLMRPNVRLSRWSQRGEARW
jgi:hypothetical protein